MKLLLDQGLPISTATALRRGGRIVAHVAEIGLERASDRDIIAHAEARGETVIVTLDSDFHALLATQSAQTPSVIRIRQEGLKGPALADLICWVCNQATDSLAAGSVVTVTADKVRVRRLPIGRHTNDF